MKRKVCLYCNGTGWINVAVDEALEQALCQFLKLRIEPDKTEHMICPKCNGTGVELEVELKDLRRVVPQY